MERVRTPDSLPLTAPTQAAANPERLAWIVLLVAFSICLLLAIGTPLAARSYVLNSTLPKTAFVQAATVFPTGGSTIRARLCGVTQPLAITSDGLTLPECATVETDPSSKAFVQFFEGSTVTLSTDTTLELHRMAAPRYQWSLGANVLEIEQTRGSARYGAAPPIPRGTDPIRPLEFIVTTPFMTVHLTPGSYSVEVDSTSARVTVREGQATVSNSDPNHLVHVDQGQSITVHPGQPLPESSGATKNLVRGGDFEGDVMDPAWTIVNDQGGDGNNVQGAVRLANIGNRRAIQIVRTGSENHSADTGIRQIIDKDVSDYRTLSFKADVRLRTQDLPGGGYLSTEYPLIIYIKYRDVQNNDAEWVHGFYFQNENNNPTQRGELIPKDVWVPYESGNLLKGLVPKPFRILWIKIYASGWDYESYISGIQLLAE